MTERDELKAVLKYRDGTCYVGSYNRAVVADMLGVEHPFRESAIDEADDEHVEAAWLAVRPYILHMREHPVRECPCCGTVVRAERIRDRSKSEEEGR